jgi:hypothetical protein
MGAAALADFGVGDIGLHELDCRLPSEQPCESR